MLVGNPRRTTQPQGSMRIDWGNPITSGLVDALIPAALRTVNGVSATVNASFTSGMGRYGAYRFSPAISTGEQYAGLYVGLNAPLTHLSFHTQTQVSAGARGSGAYVTNTSGFGFLSNAAHRAISGSSILTGPPAQALLANVLVHRVASTSHSLFVDGKRIASAATAGFTVPTTGYRLGSDGTANGMSFETYVTAVWSRILSDSEIASVSANPWQIFAPAARISPNWSGVQSNRPSADVTTAGWAPTPGPTHFSAIDDLTADDSDFTTLLDINSGLPLVTNLSASIPAGVYAWKLRARKTLSAGQVRIKLLDASSAVVGMSPWQPLYDVFTVHTLPIKTTGTAFRVQTEVQP